MDVAGGNGRTSMKYDYDFWDGSTYARALGLLERTIGFQTDDTAVVLDLACGAGVLATAVSRALGASYLGVDGDESFRASVEARGGEFASVDLDVSRELMLERLRAVIGNRHVCAVMMLDGLEHMVRHQDVLGAIREIAHDHDAPVVLSVPNVSHRDVGLKLLMGRWDYTDAGLLDETHVRFYTESSLRKALATSGLHLVDRDDVILESSDQAFPEAHPVLKRRTTIRSFLDMVRQGAETTSAVNQFVWLCHSGPKHVSVVDQAEDDLFLSVLIRTRGRRLHELRETLLCLLAQTSDDFEVLLLLHGAGDVTRSAINDLLAEFPTGLTAHIRVVDVHGGTRARPLNIGFQNARGRYVTVLDDDDHVMAHWVETFRNLEEEAGGRLLRSRCATQGAEILTVRGRAASSATSKLALPYDAEFTLLAHLIDNQTPFMSVAFPRGVFQHLGLRFDESLSTTEDWDFLLRSASLVGVFDSPEITAIYRRWSNSPASHTDHRQSEWASNRSAIDRKMDLQPILLPPGEARALRERVLNKPGPLPPDPSRAELAALLARERALHEVLALISSRSWRLTRPVRALGWLRGRPVRLEDLLTADQRSLEGMASEIRASRSWRLARMFRPDRAQR